MLILRHCRQSPDDLITCERTMLRYLSGKAKPVGHDFNVWEHTLPEIYGIILAMFCKLGLVECLNITEGELLDFIIDVDQGYLATFYHSFYHAADVTAVLFNILANMNASQYLSKPDMAALLLAGLCHDIGHPGLNNLFQVNAKTELVKQHGEVSVLEKYSCSLAMDLVAKHRLFRNVSKTSAATLPEGNRATEAFMKDAMIKAIMATDMAFHYDMLNNLNQLIEVTSSPSCTPSNSDGESTDSESESDSAPPSPTVPRAVDSVTPEKPTVASVARDAMRARFECPVNHNHRRQSSTCSTASDASDASQGSLFSEGTAQTSGSLDGVRSPSDLTPELRQNLASCLLHAADISNAVKPWALCKRWSDLVIQEFFRQGDIEKAHDLPVSPNMDRNQSQQPQISLGFGDFVVQPYFESFVEFLPEATTFLVSLASNREKWVELQKAQKEAILLGTGTESMASEMATPDRPVSAPLPAHLTSGRRVSVAAGVLVLDDSRPQRAPHRRLRHSTNTEASQGHIIRKIKRSISGRSLSSCLQGLHIHPRSLQGVGKSVIAQEAVVSVLKREAALAAKEPVNLTGSTPAGSTPPAAETASKEQRQEPLPLSTIAATHANKPPLPATALPQDPVNGTCIAPTCIAPETRFRERRHGSLQLENNSPSIRHEYGNGYVEVTTGPCWPVCGENIPLEHELSMSTSSSSSAPAPISASGPALEGQTLLPTEALFHGGQTVVRDEPRSVAHPRHFSTTPATTSSTVPSARAGSLRSSTPAVMSGNVRNDCSQASSSLFLPMETRFDRSGCGPLDECNLGPTAGPVSSISTAALSASGPTLPAMQQQQQQQGATEGLVDRIKSSDGDLATVTQCVTTDDNGDGPMNCVVSQTLPLIESKDSHLRSGAQMSSTTATNGGSTMTDGAVSLSAASSTSGPVEPTQKK